MAKRTGVILGELISGKVGVAIYGKAGFRSSSRRCLFLLACTRYIELNHVRAGLVKKPENWPWSSAGLHIKGKDDILVRTKPLLVMVYTSWKRFLSTDANAQEIEMLRIHERTGRPLGEDAFIEKHESLLDRKLKRRKSEVKKDKKGVNINNVNK